MDDEVGPLTFLDTVPFFDRLPANAKNHQSERERERERFLVLGTALGQCNKAVLAVLGHRGFCHRFKIWDSIKPCSSKKRK